MKMNLGLALFFAAAVVAPTGSTAAGPPTLDDGLLDPAWFAVPGIEFHKVEDIDYLWVRPGFQLTGRKIQVEEWSDPEFLSMKKKRDAKDSAKAVELSERFPGLLRGALMSALDGIAAVSRKEGDLSVTGRIVDCNAGSKAAKWLVGLGAGSASATWDMKLVDKASGEVVLAIHHRAISGTAMSEIDDKVIKWLEKLGDALKGDVSRIYGSGKPATK
jgi:hypothetical protein